MQNFVWRSENGRIELTLPVEIIREVIDGVLSGPDDVEEYHPEVTDHLYAAMEDPDEVIKAVKEAGLLDRVRADDLVPFEAGWELLRIAARDFSKAASLQPKADTQPA